MKKMKWLLLSLSNIFIAVINPPTYAAKAASTFYVSKGATGSNNGSCWANAWNELDQINWNSVVAGDTILIDGGSTSKTYTTPLIIGKSGTSGNSIYIKLATESGRNGKAIFWGGRSTLLPECGSHDSNWTLPNDLGRTTEGINFNSKSYVMVDGVKWNGIEIYGCNNTGATMSGSNNKIICAHIYDNGGWGQSQDTTSPYNGSPQLPGIYLAGPNMTVAYCVIHDNGEDCIQDYYQSQGGVNFTLYRSWLYNSRHHSTVNAAFNYAMHNDGIQLWDETYTKSDISITESIIGPGFMQTFVMSANYSNVLMQDCLFVGSVTDKSQQNINVYGSGSDWTIDRSTLVRPSGANWTNIDCQNTTNMVIRNTLSVGAAGAATLPAGVTLTNNYQYGTTTQNGAIGSTVNPNFVNGTVVQVGATGWDTFNFTPQNSTIINAGAGTQYTTVAALSYANFDGHNLVIV